MSLRALRQDPGTTNLGGVAGHRSTTWRTCLDGDVGGKARPSSNRAGNPGAPGERGQYKAVLVPKSRIRTDGTPRASPAKPRPKAKPVDLVARSHCRSDPNRFGRLARQPRPNRRRRGAAVEKSGYGKPDSEHRQGAPQPRRRRPGERAVERQRVAACAAVPGGRAST